MAWSAVTWAYKDLVTSAKLAQMQENIRTHDHRSDGTQGDPAAIILGPTFGAAAATLTSGVQTTVATITLPATLRKSTLWLNFSYINSVGAQRIDLQLASPDARCVIGTFTASGPPFLTSFTSPPTALLGCQNIFGIPVNVGAATGTAMSVKVTANGGNITEARVLYWLDS